MNQLILIAAASLLIAHGGTAAPPQSGRMGCDLAESESVSCGPRAALILANRLGYGMKYGQFRDGARLGDHGQSIGDLKDLLVSRGIACSVRRLDPTELRRCPAPLIAHMVPRYATSDGHFLVAIVIDQEGVLTVDPILGREEFWGWSSFSDGFSGFAVVPDRRLALDLPALATTIVVQGLLISFILTYSHHIARRRPAAMSARCARMVIGGVLLALAWASPGHSASPDELIRLETRDGINAIELLAGIYGKDAFSSGERVAQARSLGELKSLLGRRGLPSKIQSMGYTELAASHAPCIVPLRFGRGDIGNFYVVTRFGEDSITTVQAGPMIVQEMTIDDFRRRWTGHVLLPAPKKGWTRLDALVFFGSATVPPLGLFLHRIRQRAESDPNLKKSS